MATQPEYTSSLAETFNKSFEMLRKEIRRASNKTILWFGGMLLLRDLILHFFK